MMFKGFIYCATCLPTEKWYFGQTIHAIKYRWKRLNGHTIRKRLSDGLPYRGYLWK